MGCKDVEDYPKTKLFYVKDTLPEKHHYCITNKHIEYSDTIILDIEGAEIKGAVCGTCQELHNKNYSYKIMSYAEHKQILLIGCKADNDEELNKYLLSIKEQTEKDGYLGFAFIKEYEEIN